MHLSYLIPPPPLRVGGLDTALAHLKEALEESPDVRITCDTETPHPEADGVHFHGLWMPSHLRAYRHCQRAGIPYFISPHGMLEPWALDSKRWKKWPYFALVERPNLRKSQSIFVTSPIEKRNVSAVTACEHIEELPLGLADEQHVDRGEARAHFGLREDDRVLLYLSRIDPKKGLDHLLKALEGIAHADRWQLWVVGDGSPTWVKSLKQWAADKKHSLPAIHWKGPHWGAAKWPYLAAADLFCLPTHSENFGMAVLEALWVGTPVVTTPNTPWADHAAIEGIHITNNDTVSLRKELETQFNQDSWTTEQRHQLKAWSRREFHWNQLRERYLQAYSRLTSSPVQ